MKKILLIIIGMFLISFISALTLPQYSTIELKAPCTFNGTNCLGSATCTINIIYPNGSYMFENSSMSNTGTGMVNINLSDSSVLGDYLAPMNCCQNGECAIGNVDFSITRSGQELSINQSIIYFIVLIASFLIFILCLYGAIRIPYKNARNNEGEIINITYLKYVKIFLFFMGYLLLIFRVNILIGMSDSYLHLGIALTFFKVIYFILLVGLLPLIVFSLFIMIVNILKDKKLHEIITMGLVK